MEKRKVANTHCTGDHYHHNKFSRLEVSKPSLPYIMKNADPQHILNILMEILIKNYSII